MGKSPERTTDYRDFARGHTPIPSLLAFTVILEVEMNGKHEIPENAGKLVAEALIDGYDNDAQSVSEIMYEHIMRFAAASVDENLLTVPEDWITTASREIVRYFRGSNRDVTV